MDQNAPLILGSVLVVDDDLRVRTALTRLLRNSHAAVQVRSAGSVLVAEQLLQAQRPDVALVDVMLPDLDSGLRLIGTLSGIGGVRVVAISAFDGLRPAAIAAGAHIFLNKGSSAESVLQALRAHPIPAS